VAIEAAALAADSAASHSVVAGDVTVVAAAGAALLHVEALRRATVLAHGAAVLHLETARVTAVTLAIQIAFMTAAALTRLAALAEIIVVTGAQRA
jgi:hypothetical protein